MNANTGNKRKISEYSQNIYRNRFYKLASDEDYDQLINAIQNATVEDLEYKTLSRGDTVLHMLCQKREPNLSAMEAVVSKAPHLVKECNRGCMTPLHLAMDLRELKQTNDQVILLLISSCPEAVKIKAMSSSVSVLEYACKGNFGLPVLRAILEIDPSQSKVPTWCSGKHGVFATMWDTHTNVEGMELVLLTSLLGKEYEKRHQDSKDYLLHAACTQFVPRDYLENILAENLSIYTKPDPIHGNTPLHFALERACTAHGKLSVPYTQYVVTSLLAKNKSAAGVVNKQGRYPLHLAMEAGLVWEGNALEQIVKAFPEALSVPDPKLRLYPFQVGGQSGLLKQNVATVYRLLLHHPNVTTIALGSIPVGSDGEEEEEEVQQQQKEQQQQQMTIS